MFRMAAATKVHLNEGYHFYKNVLKSPKYVVAPMVAQSEVTWRMLARKHGAQLCYTPMHSAHCFVKDKRYQKQVLQDLSYSEDRPLIVQFCANNVDIFVSAASIVEKYCDGIDLNLGCPQHIARRGPFGAYLQEDWNLLHDMISHARKCVNIGITAKIRVFPEISKTIEYAKMLENAGCQLLTVHGRTRDQKRLETGLASWEHIRAVKDNVSIPVFANGNIRYGSDVERCLEETGVDGVMVAEGHLHNPLIFEGLQPDVFDVVDEYLALNEIYPTSLSIITTHMFNLLTRVFERHSTFMGMISGTSKMEMLQAALKRLRRTVDEDKEGDVIVPATGLPYWVCQPHNKFENEKIPAKEKKAHDETEISPPISKKELKTQRRLNYRLNKQLEKRQKEHQRRKEREKEIEQRLLEGDSVHKIRVLRLMEKKQIVLDRLNEAMNDDRNSVTICLDLTWCDAMNKKEINKLSSQLGRLYGSNRRCERPAHLYFTGFQRDGLLWEECVRKHNGFEQYRVDMTPLSYTELFDTDDIIYLTPDSPTALESVQPGTIYVLGGLVDETVSKKLTLNLANKAGIKTRRLPVSEYMSRSGHHSNYSTVFCVNQVFDILLNYHVTQDWKEALPVGVPPRKGYVMKNEAETED